MNTKALRQKILDLAIHGKLVPQDPNDEPASVLLERIKAEKERLIKEGKIKRSKQSKTACDKQHYAIPDSWTMAEMSDLFLLNPKSEINDEIEAGFIPMACVEDGFSGNHSFETRKWKDIKKGYCHFQNGDIGVAKISPCFENMKSCILNSLPNGIGTGTTELVILRSLGVYAPFYLYLFKSSWYISQGTKYFKGVVGQQRVNKAIFTELEVPLPSVAEQKKIVSEIKRWFTLIDIIEQDKSNLQETIKQAKSKILDLAIHGKLVPQDPTDEPASEMLKRINPKAEITCDNPQYGKLPKGWCKTTLGSIGKWQSGATPSRLCKDYYGGNIPWLKTGDLNDGIIQSIPEYITEKALEETSVKLNPKGSILLAMYGATIGKIGILSIPATTNQACCACVDYHMDKMFLFYSLLANRENFVAMGGGGAQPNISKEKITHTNISLPPINEQHRIVAKIEELFAQLDNIASSL